MMWTHIFVLVVVSLGLIAPVERGDVKSIPCPLECQATAGCLSSPINPCAAADDPTCDVDFGGSTSGVCDGETCAPDSHCYNDAIVTIIPKAGTFVNGALSLCSNLASSYQSVTELCGQSTVWIFYVHGGNPCNAANRKCQFSVTIGCTNC